MKTYWFGRSWRSWLVAAVIYIYVLSSVPWFRHSWHFVIVAAILGFVMPDDVTFREKK